MDSLRFKDLMDEIYKIKSSSILYDIDDNGNVINPHIDCNSDITISEAEEMYDSAKSILSDCDFVQINNLQKNKKSHYHKKNNNKKKKNHNRGNSGKTVIINNFYNR